MVLVMNGAFDDSAHEDLGHPERPDRLRAVMAAVADLDLGDDLIVMPPYSASRAELLRVHEGSFLDDLAAFCYDGGGSIDPDTYATFESWSIAQHAAGAGLAVIRELQRRNEGVGFVAARPPGHHALSNRAMGFCLLNNIAIATAELLSQGERVLIIDWDVHHGNGTQAIFWDEPNVLYVSTHESPLFPGTGLASEVGGPRAIDRTVNIPLPAHATGDVLRRGIDDIVAPIVEDFAPTWVLVSAGFDAHRLDPLASLWLTSGDFAAMARRVASFAPSPGRLALFLEGGYDLDALRSSTYATLTAVLGGTGEDDAPSSGGPGMEHLRRIKRERQAALEMMR
jgi:acetoin utilization deacetylase AcuC-like enzyme